LDLTAHPNNHILFHAARGIPKSMGENASVFWGTVKKHVKTKKTTLEWLAKDSGISPNTFQGWVSKNRFPRADIAVRIASSLDTSVECLVTGTVTRNDEILQNLKTKLRAIQLREKLNATETKLSPLDGMTIDEMNLRRAELCGILNYIAV
jgi:transcriptional regulator with XRE-family HTH domain